MKIETVKIATVKPNPDNPRLIKDESFRKLVKSIQDFPEMLKIRPIVVNKDMVVLGGNMRLKACKEAGLKEVPIIKAETLTAEQQKEFIIKDNVSGGEWDFDVLANEWNIDLLNDWGLEMPIEVIESDLIETENKTIIEEIPYIIYCSEIEYNQIKSLSKVKDIKEIILNEVK